MKNNSDANKTGPIVAIGGGELKDFETLPIDKMIKKLSGKTRPVALFIPTASSDAPGYWNSFKNIYGKKLGCRTDVLFLLKKSHAGSDIKRKILSADIIYVGGGNTLKMLTVWRKFGVDKLLIQAHKKGAVLSGLSAGAICWFKYGLSDSRKFAKGGAKFNMIRVKGLALLPTTASPHHIREKGIRNPGLDSLIKTHGGVGLAIDDNAALVVNNGSYSVVSSQKGSLIRKVTLRNGKLMKRIIKSEGFVRTIFS